MKSKTKIEKQLERKTSSLLVETIIAAKKKEPWVPVSAILSGPRKMQTELNLDEIDKNSREGETIIVPGKVLSQGEINKKIKVVAFSFSGKAKEKLLKSKVQISNILDEIKRNPDAKNIRILTR